MVELRKRKAPPSEPAAPPPMKKSNSLPFVTNAANPIKRVSAANSSSPRAKFTVGDSIDPDSFGGDISTHAGEKTTLKKLLDSSRSGVVLFTYPRASTPGCTTQACLFRDDYTSLTGTGYSLYGLSTDSPKLNTTFKTKQKLPYTLLCDPYATLISAIGMKKTPKGTIRGVFVINKQAKIEVIFAGGPAATVNEIRKFIHEASEEIGIQAEETQLEEKVDPKQSYRPRDENADESHTKIAAEVADTAEQLD